jgi:hypothetical protein
MEVHACLYSLLYMDLFIFRRGMIRSIFVGKWLLHGQLLQPVWGHSIAAGLTPKCIKTYNQIICSIAKLR